VTMLGHAIGRALADDGHTRWLRRLMTRSHG
jgi:hypothetical protein